jgi:S-DNA-T family DNA segregation ATPase FtsK/SpoIIIE
VDTLCTLLDDADPARGSAELFRLVRDGAAVGVTCVLTAERAIPGGRLAGIAQHRLVLPLPDRADYAVAGVPLAAVPSIRSPGRAVVGEDAAECQLVLPPPIVISGSTGRARTAPLRIAELDPDPIVEGGLDSEETSSLRVALGPGGDEGEILGIELLRTGGLLVVGPPGSGRTTTLHALMGDLAVAGVPVLHLGTLPTGSGRAAGVHPGDLMDTAATTDWLSGRGSAPAVVCVDDLGPAGSTPALAALPPLGAVSGVVLIAAAAPADVSTWFQGPVAALRRARSGLLLSPGPGDADALGIRLPRTPVPARPGSGWLVRAGTPDRVQVARHRPRARQGAAQSSSSTGPISCVAYQASS